MEWSAAHLVEHLVRHCFECCLQPENLVALEALDGEHLNSAYEADMNSQQHLLSYCRLLVLGKLEAGCAVVDLTTENDFVEPLVDYGWLGGGWETNTATGFAELELRAFHLAY